MSGVIGAPLNEPQVGDDRGGPATPLLAVNGLVKHFGVKGGFLTKAGAIVRAVDGVNFNVAKGETLGIVGESGCGKSTVARLIMQIIKPDAGELLFDGEAVGSQALDLTSFRKQVQMIFQDSYASLNPRLTVEDTVAFGPRVHGMSRQQSISLAHDLLHRVGLDPGRFAGRYPHEISGGQRQRVNIARGLALNPRLLILDEAVSALDKSVEAQVLNLLLDLKAEFGLTYIFISHDLNVVRFMSDRVMVMYLGKVAEVGPADDVFSRPGHPYTEALLASMPSMDPDNRTQEAPITGDPPNPINPPPGCRFHTRCKYVADVCKVDEPFLCGMTGTQAIVDVKQLTVDFATGGGSSVRAVAGVDLSLKPGETLALLGESGSGKSVTLRALMRLHPKSAKFGGSVKVDERDVLAMSAADLARYRGKIVSMIFQDPGLALDPVYRVGDQIAEAVMQHESLSRAQGLERALELFKRVRIPSPERRLDNYPHEMSGGMRQRAMIALALACRPKVLLADEPTTALDATVQIQVLLLLRELQRELGLAVIFVTHDIGVAVEVADRIAVMYGGRIVEMGKCADVIRNPAHPYTHGLLASRTGHAAEKGSRLVTIPGSPPDLTALPPGCSFSPRCTLAIERCRQIQPPPLFTTPDHFAACIRIEEAQALAQVQAPVQVQVQAPPQAQPAVMQAQA